MDLNTFLIIGASFVVVTNPQNVPPGVNPNTYQQQQQYQQPPPPQQVQYHQQQQQQQQPVQGVVPHDVQYQAPVQHQPPPPPVQHHQPPPQHHQPPPQQIGHGGHHDHHGQPQLLNTANLAEEREHMQEHLNVKIDTSKMTEQELQFHYFKMHDADNNNKLDGCELIKSLIHWHEQGHQDPSAGQQAPPQEKIFTDEELTNLIDPILNMDDADGDGFIDYPEFVRAQQKAAVAATQQQGQGRQT